MEEQLRIRDPTEQRRDLVFFFLHMMNQDTETETTGHCHSRCPKTVFSSNIDEIRCLVHQLSFAFQS